MKYFIDYFLIVIIFPIFVIIFPLISLMILIFDSSPIIYSQKRVGLGGKEFSLYKFRTMSVSSDESVHKEHYKDLSSNKKIEPSLTPDDPIRIENDDRITKIGSILRKTSLDELPNVLNVIIGDMSLVGPRPLVDYESELYGKYNEKRNSVLPGITGLAQVQGRLDLSLQERLYWDLKYIDSNKLSNDLFIIFKTIASVIRRKGAN